MVRHILTALKALVIVTLVLGIAYPLAVLGVGQVVFPAQANGSLVLVDGDVVGSALIGQSFATGPEWFQSRPSATGYDGGASSGSNDGPNNPDLTAAVEQRAATATAPDALTASGSGLDPQISPANALEQVPRVAEARGLDETAVRELVESMIQGRDLGYLGEPTVNVLALNIALRDLDD